MDGFTSAELAAELARRKPKKAGRCAVCGGEFIGTKRRRYCSRTCADRAFYLKHKAERNAARVKAKREQRKSPPPAAERAP